MVLRIAARPGDGGGDLVGGGGDRVGMIFSLVDMASGVKRDIVLVVFELDPERGVVCSCYNAVYLALCSRGTILCSLCAIGRLDGGA